MTEFSNGIRIFNEDCIEGLKKLPSNCIDLIVTDPPYFIDGMDDGWDDEALNAKRSKAKVIGGLPVGMKFDPMQGKKLQEFMERVCAELIRVLKPGGFCLTFSQGRLLHRMALAVENCGFEIRDMLIWEHQGGMAKAFSQDHFVKRMDISEDEKSDIIAKLQGRKTPQLKPKFEPVVLAQKPKEGTFVENWLEWGTGLVDIRPDGKTVCSTIFKGSKPSSRAGAHLAVKPVDVTMDMISVFSTAGQIVLDPFMGTGTTGVAAINLGRRFVGFEKEPKYYMMAAQRFRDETDAVAESVVESVGD